MTEATLTGSAPREARRFTVLLTAENVAFPVMLFLVSRCMLALLAWRAPQLLAGPHIAANNSVLPAGAVPSWLDAWMRPWFRFDAAWYIGIAQHGYHWGSISHTNTNFMPLYPALIAILSHATPLDVWSAALTISNVAFLAALMVLWHWSNTILGREIAPRAILLVAAFPFSFFFAAPYAEPLFLALAVGAFFAAERDRWTLATILAAACTVTRPVGIAVVLGIAILALTRGRGRDAAIALLALIPIALFAAYLGIAFGHPLGFTVYHTYGWVAPHGGVWGTVIEQFHTKLSPFDRVDAALAVLFLASGVAAWRRFGAGYGVYTIMGVLLPLTKGLAGMERYVIVLFPAIALWATWKNRWAQTAIFSLSALTLMLATIMFGSGYSLF